MIDPRCPNCGCTGIHACMGKPLSDGAIYASYGDLELKVIAHELIQGNLQKLLDEDTKNLVS